MSERTRIGHGAAMAAILLALVASATAQPVGTAPPGATGQPADTAATPGGFPPAAQYPAPPPGGAGMGGTGSQISQELNPRLRAPITLRAKDASLAEVLQVLSERSGMNFVTAEGVNRERITIILQQTPLSEAINLVVRAAGLSYEIIGNSVLVAEPGKLKDETGLSGYVISLKYARAEEVAVMLADVTKSLKIDKGGNRIIAYTSPRVILEIDRIVRSIDHPNIQVMLETRLIEVSSGDLERYGIDWARLSPVTTGIHFPGGRLEDLGDIGDADNWRHDGVNLNLALDLLMRDNKARVLMNSKLTTTNNREATLHIGKTIPYVIQSYNLAGTGGGGANREIQKEEVGVKVAMTPYINEVGEITLNLEPEVSSVDEYRGEGNDLPVVSIRKTKTTVRVADGQKIFIAGLLQEEKRESIDKFPLLGQIPVLGYLFQHRNSEYAKTNLIIEIRPRIIRTWQDAAAEAATIAPAGNGGGN